MRSDSVHRLTLTAVCVALCCVFPQVLPQPINQVLSPIHIPVLLCGLLCGGGWGSVCGAAGFLLASALFGKPHISMLPTMLPELVVYGLVCGLGAKWIRTGKPALDLYLSLGASMLLGRIAGGVASAIFYAVTAEAYSLSMWLTGYFVNALPGIAAHLILVPLLVFTLTKARLLPGRFEK